MADIETVYPFLEDGLDFLKEKGVLDGAAYKRLSKVEKLKIVGTSTLATIGEVARLKAMLVQSAKAGDDERQFRQRIETEIDLKKSDANRILRTNTKQVYIEGMGKTLEKSHIQEAFPYVLYVATHDGRTRESHRKLDGFVAEVGSPEYQTLKRALSDWNCRCSLIPLTAKQAESRGIQVYKNLPIEIRRDYGKEAA